MLGGLALAREQPVELLALRKQGLQFGTTTEGMYLEYKKYEQMSSVKFEYLEGLGAAYVAGLEVVAGDDVGAFVVGSRWDSLDTGFSSLHSFYEDPEVQQILQVGGIIPFVALFDRKRQTTVETED